MHLPAGRGRLMVVGCCSLSNNFAHFVWYPTYTHHESMGTIAEFPQLKKKIMETRFAKAPQTSMQKRRDPSVNIVPTLQISFQPFQKKHWALEWPPSPLWVPSRRSIPGAGGICCEIVLEKKTGADR